MAKTMLPRERELIMLEGGTPDRMLAWALNSIVVAKHYGVPFKDVRGDAELSVKLMRDFARESLTDIIAPPCIEMNSIVMDLPGVETGSPDDNYSKILSHYYVEPGDVEGKELLDPRNPKETPLLWKYFLGKVALMAEKEKDYLSRTSSWGVITTAGYLRGVETLLMDIVLEPELAKKTLANAAWLVDGALTSSMENGIEAAMIADPTGSGSLVSGETFEKFVTPLMRRMVSKYRTGFGAPIYLHVCGDTVPVAKALKGVGADVFSFDYMNDIGEIREIMGDTILAGNLDPMNVVWQGTPEKVIAASKAIIEKERGERHILATGCETPRDTPIANLRAMRTAVEEYATYR